MDNLITLTKKKSRGEHDELRTSEFPRSLGEMITNKSFFLEISGLDASSHNSSVQPATATA